MQLSPEDWFSGVNEPINPLKYAGEGYFATEEYARPEDIEDPWVRSDVGQEGDDQPPFQRRMRR